jgi:DNA polymerase-3 subunit epsilon
MMEGNPSDKYFALAERAQFYLEQVGGRATEEALIFKVFNVRGKPEIWGGILTQALRHSDRFRRLPSGEWVLTNHGEATQPLLNLEYVVLDCETTGLHPQRNRMIEIAAIRLRGGQKVDTFQSLINPRRRIPDYIAKLTGIDNALTNPAPTFNRISDKLLDFIGNSIIVGHNVLFDMRFLNYELYRLQRPSLANETLDTITLAVRLFPGIRRPNLDRLAQFLGIQVSNRHRAYGDASITATAFIKLLETAGTQGFSTLEDLRRGKPKTQAKLFALEKELEPPVETKPSLFEIETPAQEKAEEIQTERPVHISNPKRTRADAEIQSLTNRATARVGDVLSPEVKGMIKNLPEKPGVYLMKEASGKIIYVGKAINLRKRVKQYYSEPLGYTRKMEGLAEAIRQIDHTETGSELEALLLESKLIKQYLPRYNTLLRNYESYPFIKISLHERFPRIIASREVMDDGARYFGPFQNRRAVDSTIDIIEQLFPVRNCMRKFEPEVLARKRKHEPPCLRFHTKRCPGPCTGKHSDPDHAEYMQTIDEVINFLSGGKEAVLDHIWARLRRSVEQRDFENAARLRDVLHQVERIVASQEFLAAAVEGNNLLICLPSALKQAGEILCIYQGRLGKQIRLTLDTPLENIAKILHNTWQTLAEKEAHLAANQPAWGKKGGRVIGQEAVDEINIIARWVYKHHTDPAIVRLGDSPDWVETAAILLERLHEYDRTQPQSEESYTESLFTD